jgi:hypothetical protein
MISGTCQAIKNIKMGTGIEKSTIKREKAKMMGLLRCARNDTE